MSCPAMMSIACAIFTISDSASTVEFSRFCIHSRIKSFSSRAQSSKSCI